MINVFSELTDRLREFIESQSVFFVANAPLAQDGHVNLSRKGLDTFRVLDARRVAYLDLTGSSNETAAHIGENGRITIMFCAFQGAPKILRLFGRGRAVLASTSRGLLRGVGSPLGYRYRQKGCIAMPAGS
jgi:hypothetical protein